MAYSYTTATGTGASQNINLSFGYIDRTHVKVYVAGVLKTVNTDYAWVTASTIQLTAAGGAAILVQRVTPLSARLTDYLNGVPIGEAELDIDSLQAFYLLQERADELETFLTDLANGGGVTLQTGITVKDEGAALGTVGTVEVLDFVGDGVSASRAGDVVTVTISGGGGAADLTEALSRSWQGI